MRTGKKGREEREERKKRRGLNDRLIKTDELIEGTLIFLEAKMINF